MANKKKAAHRKKHERQERVPEFAVVTMTKNEATNIGKQIESLRPFLEAGGHYTVYDTGSTDDTCAIVTRLCKPYAHVNIVHAGEKHHARLSVEQACWLNTEFETSYFEPGTQYFDFAGGKNGAASTVDSRFSYVLHLDACDSIEHLDIGALNNVLKSSAPDMIFNTHYLSAVGTASWQKAARMFNRNTISWRGACHEALSARDPSNYSTVDVAPTTLSFRYTKDMHKPRSYIVPLALQALETPAHRWFYYLGREFYYRKMWWLASRVFERASQCANVAAFPEETAGSYSFWGECELGLAKIYAPESADHKTHEARAVRCFFNAIWHCGHIREPWIRLAHVYRTHNMYSAAKGAAYAALSLPKRNRLYEHPRNYAAEPHDLLYWAHSWLGEWPQARAHYDKACAYEPGNQRFKSERSLFYHDDGRPKHE